MLKTLIIFLVLVLGLIIGPMIAGHQGIAFFQLAGYRIKMSFTTFVIIEIIFLIAVYLLYWFLRKITSTSSFFGRWLRMLSPNKSLRKIAQANLMILEGNYKKAEKYFSQGAKSAVNPAIVYLQAAQAAIDSNDLIAAHQHLEQAAAKSSEKEQFALSLIQLRLQIKNREFNTAKQQVETLLDQKPRHPEILRLADEIYYNLKDYQAIIDILPAMYKTQAYDEIQLDQFKQSAYLGLIKQLAQSSDKSALHEWWKSQPKIIRNNPIYQKLLAEYLSQLGYQDEAKKLLSSIAKLDNQ